MADQGMKSKKIARKASQVSTPPVFPEPSTPPPANRRPQAPPLTAAELASWVRRAKDLPDIRWEKVKALREAIRHDSFDLDRRLTDLADKLPEELLDYLRRSRQ